MFQYSFSTVFIAILASNLLLIMITIFFRSEKIMANAGFKLLALFIGFTALRFLLPFELPFAVRILFPEFISQIISRFCHPFSTISGYDISAWTCFECIWGIGFLVNLLLYIRDHAKARYFILANSLDATTEEPYASLLDRICRERNRKNRFQILTMTGINKPMVYGVFFPRILIPENIEMTEKELYYSLVHEASHHFHHDLLIKKIIKFITMVYWWNPVCYILNRKTNIILEMRVDDALTKADKQTISEYLHFLISLSEREISKTALSNALTMSILSNTEDDLTKRFSMLMSVTQKKSRTINLLLFLSVLSIYLTSYCFIFEAHYVSPDVVETSVGQTENNTYAVLKEDGTYDVYYKDYLLENVDSLQYYNSDIPIYTEKEITNEKN